MFVCLQQGKVAEEYALEDSQNGFVRMIWQMKKVSLNIYNICIHTYAHKHTHARTHARMYTHIRICMRTHMNTQTRTHNPTHTHVYMDVYVYTHAHICVYTMICMCTFNAMRKQTEVTLLYMEVSVQ